MRKLFVMCSLMLGMTSMQAQDNIFEHLGASIGVGTTGVSIDVSTGITDYVGIRAGVDIMPKISYKTDIDISSTGLTELSSMLTDAQFKQILGVDKPVPPKKVDIEGKLNNTTGHFLVDLYPFKALDWHLTVGAYFGPSQVVDVYTTDDSQLASIAKYNKAIDQKISEGATLPSSTTKYSQNHKIGAELGDYFLEPSANGHIDAYIKTSGFRPYVGLGWGRAVPKNHTLGFSCDLGVQFWGTPKVYCQDKELKESDVEGNDGGAMKTITKISVYPTLTFRLTGKIF